MKRSEAIDEKDDKEGGGKDEEVHVKKKKLGLKAVQNAIAKSSGSKLSPKLQPGKKPKSNVALMKVFPNELEAQPEFEGFTEWLQTFDLYRGKQTEEMDFEDDGRVVGKFKV